MANTPITPFRLTNLTKSRLEQLATGGKTMTDVIAQLITDAALEAGIVAVLTVETMPEHDPYVNLSGHSSTTTLHIDPRDRTCWVTQEYKTNSMLMTTYHGLTLERQIAGYPDADKVREWLTIGNGQELLRAVCDGFDTHWTGHNMVGNYTDEALAALETLSNALDYEGESIFGSVYEFWSLEDLVIAYDWGVTAETSDEKLDEIISNVNATIRSERYIPDGDVGIYLRSERERMREEAEYDAE